MSIPKYLFLSRHGIYYFRVVVPMHFLLCSNHRAGMPIVPGEVHICAT